MMTTITEFIAAHDLLHPEDRVLCAVSGGADSMCMLSVLKKLESELGIQVFAAHYEHGIRGEESLRDAAFTEAWCTQQGIHCEIGHGDVPTYAESRGMGLEEAARELRYAFLEATADKLNCQVIATAHNADDNAETMLFHLARGTGLTGLTGIPVRRGRIIRPLLCLERSEIEEYLKANGIPHVEDSSNAADVYARNRIRHRVLPVLREINPAAAEAFRRTADLLGSDSDYLNLQAEAFLRQYASEGTIPQKEFCSLHPAIGGRVIRALSEKPLSAGHVDDVLSLARGNGVATLDLPGIRVRREQGVITFEPADRTENSAKIEERELIPGTDLEMPEAGIVIRSEYCVYPQEINGLFKTYFFKSSNICGKITVTGRKPGDRIRPAYRNCSKTLKQLFLEAHMTQAQRDAVPVLRDEKGILAAGIISQDERTIPEAGDRVLKIQIIGVEKC